MYSGFGTYGLSINGVSTDRFLYLYFSSSQFKFFPPDYCGLGMYMGKYCQFCLPGSYSRETDVNCILCPPGTYNNIYGASDPTQCIPCPIHTYSNSYGSTECIKCSFEYTCYIVL